MSFPQTLVLQAMEVPSVVLSEDPQSLFAESENDMPVKVSSVDADVEVCSGFFGIDQNLMTDACAFMCAQPDYVKEHHDE